MTQIPDSTALMGPPSSAPLQNRYTRMIGIAHPVVQEGMGPFNTARLAAAVSNAGGLGTVSVPGTDGDLRAAGRLLRSYVDQCAQLTDGPFAVNIPVGHRKDGRIATFSRVYLDEVLTARRADEHGHVWLRRMSSGNPNVSIAQPISSMSSYRNVPSRAIAQQPFRSDRRPGNRLPGARRATTAFSLPVTWSDRDVARDCSPCLVGARLEHGSAINDPCASYASSGRRAADRTASLR